MDKIARIRQEIERRITDNTFGAKLELIDILAWLDTLSEEPDKSLEEAARRYAIPTYMKDVDENFLDEYPYDPVAEKAFIAGAEWQKKRFEAEYELDWLTDLKKDLYELGRKDEREQMLKDAVEGEAEELYNDGESQCTVGVGTYFKPGEKVYVLKAEEEQK